MRGLDDVKAWLSQENTGSAETAAAPFWRLLCKYRTDAKVVIVRRPVNEVVDSLLALDMQEAVQFDRYALTKRMRQLNAKLDQIEHRIPVLSVSFADLVQQESCAHIFEYCLPYSHDRDWYARLASVNIQCSMPAMVRYATANRIQLDKLSSVARHVMLRDLQGRPQFVADSLVIGEEKIETSYPDAQRLFAEHCVEVGEAPDSYLHKNLELMKKLETLGNMQIVTARSNGRMFGYLMTVISPSLESDDGKTIAVHTLFFSSPEFPGLGLKLQRAALDSLKKRNVDEVFFRAGPRGAGPKMGVLYRRLGALDDGNIFRLSLKDT